MACIAALIRFLAALLALTLPRTISGAPNPVPALAPLDAPETNPIRPNNIDNSNPQSKSTHVHPLNPNAAHSIQPGHDIHRYPPIPPQLTITLSASSSPNGTNHTNSTNSTTHHPGNGAGNGTLWYYCDGGPTINATSAGSPLIRDCRALIADIETHEWSYKWISCSQHALVSNGTCVFGIETVPDNICLPFTTLETGNGDIVEWIRDSIARWGELDKGEEGRVGSWGESRCHNIGWWRDDYMRVKWGLYHS